jgi:hypothetical protein
MTASGPTGLPRQYTRWMITLLRKRRWVGCKRASAIVSVRQLSTRVTLATQSLLSARFQFVLAAVVPFLRAGPASACQGSVSGREHSPAAAARYIGRQAFIDGRSHELRLVDVNVVPALRGD